MILVVLVIFGYPRLSSSRAERRDTMDWATLYCPNRACSHYGRRFWRSLLVKNGSTRGQKQARCQACGRSVALTYGTAYFDLDAEPALFDTVTRALAEGNGLRATGRIVQIDKDTVASWLRRAAVHCRAVMLYLWDALSVSECQLDELWSFVHTKERHLVTAKRCCDSYGDTWIWLAFAPVWRLVLAFVVGKRTQESANLLLERVVHVTDDHLPFFTSDQLAEYRTALLHAYGQWYQPVRQGPRGPHPQPRRIPRPDLLYAQVVKERERGHVVAVSSKVVFGDSEIVKQRIAASRVSATINTSFVERENLTLRQHTRRLTRDTNGFSKDREWLETQLWLVLAYYHLVLPHASLAQEAPVPAPTRGSGSPRRWLPVTPAMAAGITDHVWTTTELLSYRVPVDFLDQLPKLESLFPPLTVLHHGN
jgi:IS1 family transposase/transposase-like protein